MQRLRLKNLILRRILILVYLAVFMALESAVRTLSLPKIIIVPMLLIQPLSDLIRKNKTLLILCSVGVVSYFLLSFCMVTLCPNSCSFEENV